MDRRRTRTDRSRRRSPVPLAVSSLPAVAILLAGPTSAEAQAADRKLYFEPCPAFAESYAFDCYHSYDEVSAFLRSAVAAHPERARLESMGRSWEGRDLWVVTITDFETGPPEEKPALWVDGGIDSDEVVAVEAALGVVHELLTSDSPEILDLLAGTTFYVAPMVMPDATHRHYTTPVRPRDTTLRPWDDDNDGLFDEDSPDDLDGDEMALQMRVVDPDGDLVRDERDGRVMRARRADDEGPFYRVYPEGLDDDGDGRYAEDPFGGVDPNRNYPGDWSIDQGGSGPFPGSEPGLRAMLDFALAHPNIAASQHFHSSGGVVLRPPSVPDMSLPGSDEALYLELSRLGLEATGYDLATTVYDWNWPRGSANRKPTQVWRDADGRVRGAGGEEEPLDDAPFEEASLQGAVPERAMPVEAEPGETGAEDAALTDARAREVGTTAYPAYGGSIDGMYLLFGALAFAVEIYAMGDDLNDDGNRDAVEQLAYNDQHMDGYAFKEWTPFDHPQLGAVEIGGWRKFGHNNPPPSELAREVERNVAFVLMQASHLPRLAVGEPRIESLGGGIHRVTATVRNIGFQPTELAIRVGQDRAVPVRASLEGADVLSERSTLDLGVIAGHRSTTATWLVRAGEGAAISIRAWHPKAGRASAGATLGR